MAIFVKSQPNLVIIRLSIYLSNLSICVYLSNVAEISSDAFDNLKKMSEAVEIWSDFAKYVCFH